MRAILLGFGLLALVPSSFADIPFYKWQPGTPKYHNPVLIQKTKGCDKANICIGTADVSSRGGKWEELITCDSQGGACPDAEECVNSDKSNFKADKNPKTFKTETAEVWSDWDEGFPRKITRSAGCATPNICYGKYTKKKDGANKEDVIVSTGYAFCNGTAEGCDNATDCIKDEELTVEENPGIINRDGAKARKKGDQSGDI